MVTRQRPGGRRQTVRPARETANTVKGRGGITGGQINRIGTLNSQNGMSDTSSRPSIARNQDVPIAKKGTASKNKIYNPADSSGLKLSNQVEHERTSEWVRARTKPAGSRGGRKR